MPGDITATQPPADHVIAAAAEPTTPPTDLLVRKGVESTAAFVRHAEDANLVEDVEALHGEVEQDDGDEDDNYGVAAHGGEGGAVAAGLLLAHRRLGALAAVAALLMAFARVNIAAYSPWDVAGGLVLGAAVAVGGWLLLRTPLTAIAARVSNLPELRSAFGQPDLAELREAPPHQAHP